jgi:DNA-binding PadR family transcriptional regulator
MIKVTKLEQLKAISLLGEFNSLEFDSLTYQVIKTLEEKGLVTTDTRIEVDCGHPSDRGSDQEVTLVTLTTEGREKADKLNQSLIDLDRCLEEGGDWLQSWLDCGIVR